MLKRIYITVVLIIFSQGLLFAQTAESKKANSIFKTATNNYKAFKYAAAIKAFQVELQARPNNIDAQAMLADSYRKIEDYDNALIWYAKITQNATIKPEWALCYAEVLANKQQYELSDQWYKKYLQMVNKDVRAISFVGTYPNVDPFLTNRNEWKIAYLNINTAASEYSPMYYKNGLLFSSNRKGKHIGKRVFEWDESPFSDLYFVKTLAEIKYVNVDSILAVLRKQIKGKDLYRENDDDTYATSNDSRIVGTYNIKMLKDTVGDYLSKLVDVEPMPGKINSIYHEGPASLLPDGSIIFTRNNYNRGKYAKSKEGINKLKLYTAKAPDFTDIEPFIYNSDQYSVGHPAVNKLGTVLIFASDMPGGFGGTDLWYCIRATTKDQWSKPINMGPVINTEGNEMFPTLHLDNTLYFSSTGHPGLGGLDIFQIGLNGVKVIGTPLNVGAPINSSVDDFGFIRSADGKDGYFTSNRKGSDDIYGFIYKPFRILLKGLVVDADSGEPIFNSTITMKSTETVFPRTDAQGTFNHVLEKTTDYSFTAAKDGYIGSGEGLISTKGITSDTTLTITLKLRTEKVIPPAVEVKTFGCDTLRKLVAVKKIYYDLDKSFIRPDAEPELQYLIAVLNTHPELNVILASHCDSRASSAYNVALSFRRSSSSRAYLLAHGVNPLRIKIEYYGKSRLVNKCLDGVPCSEADQQLNRRTEFILTKNGKELQDVDCDWLQNYFNEKKPVVKAISCDSLHQMVAVRKIYYDLDKSFIRPDAHTELSNLIAVLNAHPAYTVILASHCDSRASSVYNVGLSMRRSQSSKAYLLTKGISESRIKIEYYGKSRLTNKCLDGVPCSEADQQLNRRTEFILVKDGKELQDADCKILMDDSVKKPVATVKLKKAKK